MTVPRYISSLKAIQMKPIAFWLGSPTSGLKAQVQETLSHRISHPPPRSEFSRILSIDMGIRNLGICVLEAPQLSQTGSAKASPLTVRAWQTVDVTRHLKPKSTVGVWDSDTSVLERKELASLRKSRGPGLNGTDFTPANLAEAAYALVSSLLQQYRPSAILIERQRFRNAGAPSINEWTLRINLLEHMIWASLKTLSAQFRRGGDAAVDGSLAEAVRGLEAVREVSPAKVGKFWCGGVPYDIQAITGRDSKAPQPGTNVFRNSGVEKAQKIAVAQAWVDQWKAGGDREMESVALNFEGTAAETAKAFHSVPGKKTPKRMQKKEDPENGVPSLTKLDDLADCLLQGVAWVKWEENRRRFVAIVAKG